MWSDSSCDERRQHKSYRDTFINAGENFVRRQQRRGDFSEAPASPCLACIAVWCDPLSLISISIDQQLCRLFRALGTAKPAKSVLFSSDTLYNICCPDFLCSYITPDSLSLLLCCLLVEPHRVLFRWFNCKFLSPSDVNCLFGVHLSSGL